MSELPALTARQAEAAVDRASESLALTSGAGCGKTLVLARRFTTLLMESQGAGGSPLDRFVALTFTEKAASEMVARVRRVLLEALAKSADPGERRRLADWITELPAAHISTIHGFCASLLRRHAIEAGVDPGFAVCPDELLVGQMLAESAEDAVVQAVETGHEALLALLARVDLGRVVADVHDLLARRVAWSVEEYADPGETLARWRRRQAEAREAELKRLAADEAVRSELEYLRDAPCSTADDRLKDYRSERLPIIERMLDGDDVAEEDLAALGKPPGNVGSAKAWGGREAMMDFRGRLREFVAAFAGLAPLFAEPNDADRQAAETLETLTRLADAANRRYRAEKRRAGVLDFDDLIELTGKLLRDNKTVREGLRKSLGQLLIDEAQDTDAVQLTMLWNMLAEGETPPPGKLFIVGDLKQSIYRFRGAQAEVFDELCRRFGSANRIPLDESFRTHRAGVAFVNHLFSRLMAGYEPVKSSRRERPGGPSVEILLAEVDEGATAADAVEAQAQLTAERIAELIGGEKRVWDRAAKAWRAVRAGDIAILFSRMTKSLDYERALQQRDIPYYVVAGTGFFQQQEVFDVLNALRVVDNPADDVALVGTLRSALFGFDDNALLHVALAAGPPYFDKLTSPEVLDRLSPDRREKLAFAADLLARLHRGKDALGPAAVIETLLEATGYPAVLLGQFQGKRKLGNVYRLLEAARSSAAAGVLPLADFVARYGEFVIAGSRYEQAAVASEGEDVVRIMTIHKAKGLEFPVVIVPDLNAGAGDVRAGLLLRPDWGLTCPAPAAGEPDAEPIEPVSVALARRAERADLAAEDIRKLYVATSRHEDHLILIGADWRSASGAIRGKDSLLSQIDGVLDVTGAIDRGQTEISYSDAEHGTFPAAVSRRRAQGPSEDEPSRTPRSRGGLSAPSPPGRRVIRAAATSVKLAEGLSGLGKPIALPLVGPLTAPAAPASRVAATALADFEHCPRLFRWRHELRAPAMAGRTGGQRRGGDLAGEAVGEGGAALDPATAGTLFHRCMELLDFDAAELPAQADALVPRVLGEMELTVEASGLIETFAAMLSVLAGGMATPVLRGHVEGPDASEASPGDQSSAQVSKHGHPQTARDDHATPPLGGHVEADGAGLLADIRAASERLRELDFVMSVPGVEVVGQIDLLYRARDGRWRIVDYKSDRIGPEGPAAHAERYELQMLLYLAAAARHLRAGVADATLCFLRTGQAHRFAPAPEQAEVRLARVAERLRHCRRAGDYPRRPDTDAAICAACPCIALCLRGDSV